MTNERLSPSAISSGEVALRTVADNLGIDLDNEAYRESVVVNALADIATYCLANNICHLAAMREANEMVAADSAGL